MIGKAAILMFSSLFVLIEENQVNGLKCYVCDDEGTNPCYNFEFDKNKFIQECSALEKGCFTESHVNKKYRSCASQTLNDCKVANGVEYCFCSTELCNDNEGKFINPTDDEDLLEGSGTKLLSTVTEEPKVIVQNSTSIGFVPNNFQYLLLIPVFAFMY